MTKRAMVFAAVVSMVLVPVVVKAGYKQAYPTLVTINADGSASAGGSLSDARSYPSNSTVFIGCEVSAYSGYGFAIDCSARDASNNYAFCYSADPNLVSVVAAMNVGSSISFNSDASSACTSITMFNYSQVSPTTP